MTNSTVKSPRDCTECRIIGAVGLVGIGGYLANIGFKNKTIPGRIVILSLSFVFVGLGVSRYRNDFPFNKSTYAELKELSKSSS